MWFRSIRICQSNQKNFITFIFQRERDSLLCLSLFCDHLIIQIAVLILWVIFFIFITKRPRGGFFFCLKQGTVRSLLLKVSDNAGANSIWIYFRYCQKKSFRFDSFSLESFYGASVILEDTTSDRVSIEATIWLVFLFKKKK